MREKRRNAHCQLVALRHRLHGIAGQPRPRGVTFLTMVSMLMLMFIQPRVTHRLLACLESRHQSGHVLLQPLHLLVRGQ